MTPVYKLSDSKSFAGDVTYYSSMLAGNAAYSPVLPSSYDLLQTTILTGSQASVTFSNLNSTYGSTYQHLQIRMTARSDDSDSNDTAIMQFNADTGSNYARHGLYGDGSSVASFGLASQTYFGVGLSAASTTTANVFAPSVIDILDPFETTKYTTVRGFSGTPFSLNYVFLMSGVWMNTAALTSITIDQQQGSNWVSGCRFSLYGLKAA